MAFEHEVPEKIVSAYKARFAELRKRSNDELLDAFDARLAEELGAMLVLDGIASQG